MPGLVRAVGRTAVVAGTATAVSNRVSRRQANRWSDQEQQQAPPPQAPPPQEQYQAAPPPQYQAAPAPVMLVEAAPAAPDMDAKLGQLQQLAELKAQGILSEAEFEEQKRKILAS